MPEHVFLADDELSLDLQSSHGHHIRDGRSLQVTVSRRKSMLRNKGKLIVRVVLFAHISTLPQAAPDRHSINAQLNEMREFCARKG